MIPLLLFFLQAADPALLSQQGAQALRAQRFNEAESAYRQLVKVDPANPMWRMNLGITLHSAGRYAEAVSELGQFLKTNPAPGPAHFLLGLSHLKLKKPCEAIGPLEKAVRWNRDQAQLELADALYGCRRYGAAAKAYEAALTTTKRSPEAARQAAHCYWNARQYADAKRLFTGLPLDDPTSQYEFGDTLVRLDGPEAGLAYLERAAETLLPARSELGKALLALDRPAEALPHLEAAATADPALLLPLSKALRAVGRTAEAAAAQAEYKRKLTPDR